MDFRARFPYDRPPFSTAWRAIHEILENRNRHPRDERLRERFLGLLLTTGRSEAFLKAVSTPEAKAFGRAMLARMNVDWEAWSYESGDLDGLVEFGLRVLQSLVLDPPARRGRAPLRAFLHRWVAPAVRPPRKLAR